MSNSTIYDHATQKQIDQFKPTFLYIKQHSITGKLYFGKTVKSSVTSYMGSGTHWTKHIKKHGKEHVQTIWYCLYTDIWELVQSALALSSYMSIDSDAWLNQQPENGLGGAPHGYKKSPEEIEKMRARLRGTKQSPETIANRVAKTKITIQNRTLEKREEIAAAARERSTCTILSEETKTRISAGKKASNYKISEDTRAKLSRAGLGRKQTPEHIEAVRLAKALKRH